MENNANDIVVADVNFAVVIDAGSSGSRAYVYYWPDHSGDPRSLLRIDPLRGEDGDPLVKSVSPGLSRYLITYNPFGKLSIGI